MVETAQGLFSSFWLFVLFVLAFCDADSGGRSYSVVLPIEGRSKLKIDTEGLSVLRNINGPVAPVVVIGPYRSGKSFLLNQLLNLSCDEGFGVGHTRSTQTKGIWVWSSPVKIPTEYGWPLSVIYMDTEGFESAGKSDSYDDRIFALSTIISSVLIYNLPEAVRESDIEKLSFAVELGNGLYRGDGTAKGHSPIEPGNMIWLIQRDFLQGKTVQEMVKESLAEVDNPFHDKDIDQINRIRRSLSLLAHNSTAFGLKQPHLNRTALCTMDIELLDEGYVNQMEQLKKLVLELATPKIMQGKVMTGKELADIIVRIVEALNDRDIPSVASILDSFNLELARKCLIMYAQNWSDIQLPKVESALVELHVQFLMDTMDYYDAHRFGALSETVEGARNIREELSKDIDKEYERNKMANSLKSMETCEKLELQCEKTLDRLQAMKLPSKKKFAAEFQRCKAIFDGNCVGPAAERQGERLQVAWKREYGRFEKEYNDRLYFGMVIFSLAVIVAFRFIHKIQLLEGIGWVFFLFLEGYPRLINHQSEMYSTQWWTTVIATWEFIVYNPVVDVGWLLFAWLGILALYVLWHGRTRSRKRDKRSRERVLDV